MICLAQFALSVWVVKKSTFLFLTLGYVIGGTLVRTSIKICEPYPKTHWLQAASHELSHDLCFGTRWANKLLAIVANCPTGIPSAISFQRYHAEHYSYHGVDQLDPEIPSMAEIRLFKLIWVAILPFVYALRPVIQRPKSPGRWEFLNSALVILFDVALAQYAGYKAVVFIVYCTLIGMGLHPVGLLNNSLSIQLEVSLIVCSWAFNRRAL
jgi:sphingolipid delta-4 desaturase